MEYDFYAMGIRHAREKLNDLNKMAEAIGNTYGEDARMEFEMGIAVSIPVYSSRVSKDLTVEDIEKSSNVYGVPNERNNSYFGGIGTRHQFIERDGKITYNEKTGRKK